MTVVFPLRLLVRALLSLALPVGLVSCAPEALPTPETPTKVPDIIGTIRPANAATSVTITGAAGLSRTVKPDTSTGVLTVQDLPVGTYNLTFLPAPGYNMTTRTTTTVRGRSTDVGVVALQPNGGIARGSGSWTANDTSYTGSFAAGYVHPPTGNAYITIATQPDGSREFVKIVWDGNFRGVGTYSFGLPPVKANAGYINSRGTFGNVGPWYLQTGASGSVVVTQFDATRNIIAGTFAFEAPETLDYQGAPPSDKSIIIKTGHFSVRYVPAP